MNLRMLPGRLEYQPLIYVSVLVPAILSIVAGRRKIGRVTWRYLTLCLAAVAAVAGAAVIASGQWPVRDLVRVVSFFLVAAASAYYACSVATGAIRMLVVIHLTHLSLGVLWPEVASSISRLFAARGAHYYLGWNSYFYSEPSYAALTFLFLAYLLATKHALSVWDRLALSALSVSTLSVSGYVVGVSVLLAPSWRGSLFGGSAVIVAALVFLVFTASGPGPLSRPASRLGAVVGSLRTLAGQDPGVVLRGLNLVEPSAMWRLLSNAYSFSCLIDFPLGVGSNDLSLPLESGRCSRMLADLLVNNATMSLLSSPIAAQSVTANLLLLAGWVGLASVAGLMWLQLSVLGWREIRSAVPLSVVLLGMFLVWQSAWSAPSSSAILAMYLARSWRRT